MEKKPEVSPEKEPLEVAAAKPLLYKLSRPYWDGQVYHKADAILPFLEGAQPSSATLVK